MGFSKELFVLFRLTVHGAKQYSLLTPEEIYPSEVLRDSILAQETIVLRRSSSWHIGNVIQVDPEGLYFRFGRLSTTTLPKTDDEGNFVESSQIMAPNSQIVVNYDLGICAIEKNRELAKDVDRIALALSEYLTKSANLLEHRYVFRIVRIENPQDFITQLQSAYQVTKFWLETLPPNPWDFRGDWVNPSADAVRMLNAEKSKTQWVGDELNVSHDSLEDVIRTSAARGANGGASIRETPESPKKNIFIKIGPISFSPSVGIEVEEHVKGENIFETMMNIYQEVRNSRSSQNLDDGEDINSEQDMSLNLESDD